MCSFCATTPSSDKMEAQQPAGCSAAACLDAIHHGGLRGRSSEVADHDDHLFVHAPCADRRLLETRTQAVVIPHYIVESA